MKFKKNYLPCVILAMFSTLLSFETFAAPRKPTKPPVNKAKTAAECKIHTDKVDAQAKIVKFRYYDLLLDRNNLYKSHNSISQKHPTFGSYQGHVQKYNSEQNILKQNITAALLDKCDKFISTEAKKWASEKAPTKPNRAAANAAGFR